MTDKPRSRRLRAYGDREGDGMVQMSFSLPLAPSAQAREAAKRFAEQHGLKKVLVSAMEACGPHHAYFVVYGYSVHEVDLADVVVSELDVPVLTHDEIDTLIEQRIGRKLVIVGACTGSDAHTVGIDAILNMKGYAGDKGLESYRWIDAHNLGSQVENETLIARSMALQADAILVSQVITQRDCHKDNARALIDLMKKEGVRSRFVLLLGGPRIDHNLATELGFEAGFGPGTRPSEVASFIVQKILESRP